MKFLGFLLTIMGFQMALAISYPFHHDVLDELQKADFIQAAPEKVQQWMEILSAENVDVKIVRQIVNEAIGASLSSDSSVTDSREILVSKNIRGEVSHMIPITGEEVEIQSRHAIQNLAGYLENRVGKYFFKNLQNQKLKTFVFGSDPRQLNSDLINVLPKGQYFVTSIPSLYEKWGLYRYWIQSTRTGEAFYALVVPPSTQYVRHYATLLDSSGKFSRSQGFLNLTVQEQFRAKLKSVAKEVRINFGYLSALFFGYEKNWFEQLKKPESPWSLNYSTQVKTALGLNVHLLELRHKATLKTIRVASLQPDQTVWGELASFYFEALLDLSPKIVMFMGSAGAVRTDIQPYQVSIPEEFYVQEGLIKINNWFLEDSTMTLPTGVVKSARHGLTYSPVQQTKKYVQSLVFRNIETVDVEQALVARMISEHNKRSKSEILFGAVNVITDQPGNILQTDSKVHHDLDVLNMDAKEQAKNKAAMIGLQALDTWIMQSNSMSCQTLLK